MTDTDDKRVVEAQLRFFKSHMNDLPVIVPEVIAAALKKLDVDPELYRELKPLPTPGGENYPHGWCPVCGKRNQGRMYLSTPDFHSNCEDGHIYLNKDIVGDQGKALRIRQLSERGRDVRR